MVFDINAVPPVDRNPKNMAAHLEMYRRSQDTCRVHNPTDEDFTIYNDRMVSNEQYTIPNKNRDIGRGPGNIDVPRYIAMSYVEKMGIRIISEISKKDWDEKKKQYRQDEWGEKEERLAIRLNDTRQWEKITPILFKGVVSRYQDNIQDIQNTTEPAKRYNSLAEEMLDKLNLGDQEIGIQQAPEDIEQKKQNLINQLT